VLLDRRHVLEQRAHVRVGAPEQRRLHARHRRHVPAPRSEQIAEEPGGRPARQADAPAGRHTRSSSRADFWCPGANMTPKVESTTSKLPSA
jgi:hypothetical protein